MHPNISTVQGVKAMPRPIAMVKIFKATHLNWQYHLTFRVYRRVKTKAYQKQHNKY